MLCQIACTKTSLRNHDLVRHPGLEGTVQNIQKYYRFGKMRKYVKNHIGSCLECRFGKTPAEKKAGLLNPVTPPARPFKRIHADHHLYQ